MDGARAIFALFQFTDWWGFMGFGGTFGCCHGGLRYPSSEVAKAALVH